MPSNSIAVFSRAQPSSGLECPFQMAGLQLCIEHCAKCLNPSARGTAQLRRQPLAPFCQYCALLDDFFQTFAKTSLIFHPVLTTQLNRQCSLGVKAFYTRSFLSSYKWCRWLWWYECIKSPRSPQNSYMTSCCLRSRWQQAAVKLHSVFQTEGFEMFAVFPSLYFLSWSGSLCLLYLVWYIVHLWRWALYN